MPHTTRMLPSFPLGGVYIALTVMTLWAVSLTAALATEFTGPMYVCTIPLCLTLTFLYTGLFITAHDAMHGTVAPSHARLNNLVGRVCSAAYALFSFERLMAEHRKHHGEPASANDPDYHKSDDANFVTWYVHFLLRYISWRQVLGMALVFNVLKYGFSLPSFNLTVLWILPNVLSTLQLFTFGTYLPHREPAGGYDNPHRARSNHYPVLLSFLTCYHFGYHYEHHQYPDVPWWKLPNMRKKSSEPRYPL